MDLEGYTLRGHEKMDMGGKTEHPLTEIHHLNFGQSRSLVSIIELMDAKCFPWRKSASSDLSLSGCAYAAESALAVLG